MISTTETVPTARPSAARHVRVRGPGLTPVQRWSPVARIAALALTLLCLLLSRRWCQIISPQVWDEDGTQIIHRFLAQGWASIFEPVNGYLVLTPKLISAFSLWISILYYPLISTVLSWAFIVSVGIAVAISPTRLAGKGLCAVAIFLIPSDPEVFGLPLYTFWWASLLLFLLPIWDESRPALGWRLCFLVLGGLSSPAVILVLPLLFFRAYLHRSLWQEILIASVATVIAGVQGHFVVTGSAGNIPHPDLRLLNIVPVYFGKFLVNTNHNYVALTIAGLGLIALVGAWFHQHRRSVDAWTLLFLLVGSIGLSVARNDPQLPLSAAPRYFFFPWCLVSWILIQHFCTSRGPWSRFLVGIVAAIAVINAVPKWSRRHDDLHWAAHLRSCRLFSEYSIPVHYNGNRALAWHFTMSGKTCDEWLARDRLAAKRDIEVLPTYPYSVMYTADDGGAGARVELSGTEAPGSELVRLKLKRGDHIRYRSGSGKSCARVEIEGFERDFMTDLPLAREWVTLDFSNCVLPAEFVVRMQSHHARRD